MMRTIRSRPIPHIIASLAAIAATLAASALVASPRQAGLATTEADALKALPAYRDAVEASRRAPMGGAPDAPRQSDRGLAPVDAVLRMDHRDLRTIASLFKEARFVSPFPTTADRARRASALTRFAWDTPRLVAAGLLHLEAGLVARERGKRDVFRDQTEIAALVFAVADQPRPGRDDMPGTTGRRSALVVALTLLRDGHFADARDYLARTIVALPDDAQLVLAYGTAYETLAMVPTAGVPAGAIGSAPASDRTLNERALMFSSLRAQRSGLVQQAARLFERALTIDPNLVEARVRLARVRIIQKDDAAATPLLEQAVSSTPASAIAYVARLLLGGVRRRAGEYEAAIALFREAIEIRAEGQSAYIALAHALYTKGDRTAAAATLDEVFEKGLTPQSADPWWHYAFGRWDAVEPLARALRAEARP